MVAHLTTTAVSEARHLYPGAVVLVQEGVLWCAYGQDARDVDAVLWPGSRGEYLEAVRIPERLVPRVCALLRDQERKVVLCGVLGPEVTESVGHGQGYVCHWPDGQVAEFAK